jgi:hypothetical protein
VLCLALGLSAALTAPAAAQDVAPPPVSVGKVTISGFIHADAVFAGRDTTPAGGTGSDEGEASDSFSVPRARLGVSGAITSKITWYLQGEFANVTSDARVLRDAYLQFTATPQLAIRYGQMVAPFSLERLTTYTKLELIDRSVIASMAPSRDIGLMVFNVQPWRGWVTYGAAIINGTGQNRADDNNAKDVVGRVATKVPRLAHLTAGVNAQTGEQAQGGRRRLGADLNYEAPQYRFAVERVSQRRDYATRVDAAGFTVIGAYKHHAPQPTPHYAGYELAARYVDVNDDAETLTSHQLQAGGTYFVTPTLRVQSNVILPIGDDQPHHTARWWSRLQFNF